MPEWDRRVFNVQVTEAIDKAIQVRVPMSSVDSGANFDLRCKLREAPRSRCVDALCVTSIRPRRSAPHPAAAHASHPAAISSAAASACATGPLKPSRMGAATCGSQPMTATRGGSEPMRSSSDSARIGVA